MEMTIHQALREVKMLDKRISSKIVDFEGIKAVVESASKIGSETKAEWDKRQVETYQSINDMITRRNKIKQLISLSNAQNEVTINSYWGANKKMTVAAAIELQRYGMGYYDNLIATMKRNYRNAYSDYTNKNEQIDDEANDFVARSFANKDKQESSKVVDEARKLYVEDHRVELRDPIGLLKKIEEMEKKSEELKAELDSALSVSNATVVINIDD